MLGVPYYRLVVSCTVARDTAHGMHDVVLSLVPKQTLIEQ